MGLQGRYFRQRQIREAAVKAGRRILRARSDRDPKRTRDPADCGRPRGVDSSNIAGPFAALNAAFHELANYFPMPYLGFASWVASILLEHLPYAGYDIRSSCAGEVMQNYTKVRTIRARALHAGALIIGTSGLWTPSLPAAAADAATTGAGDKLAEIVVTAQRREQNMQDVGTSVTAFDAKTLEQFGFKNVTDIAGQVPGLQYNQYGATVTIYNLRGVSQNDFSDHQEAPVAVYSDDAYIASTGALAGSMFDLQRVEVLRGPQGTLFGRNATGGLIQYVSASPTDHPEGYMQITGGNFGTIQSEGAVSGPLTDALSARVSFSTADHNGYITNRVGPDVNDQKQYAARLQFLLKLGDNNEIRLKLHALNNDHEIAGNYSWAAAIPDATGRGVFAPPGTPDLGGYVNPSTSPFNQAENREGLFNRTVWGANLRATFHLPGDVTLVSVTDYLKMQKRYGEDSDMSPNFIFNYDTGQHYQQFSEELRLNGAVGGFRWITGLYYLNYFTRNFEYTH